jgi:hypothetical protein
MACHIVRPNYRNRYYDGGYDYGRSDRFYSNLLSGYGYYDPYGRNYCPYNYTYGYPYRSYYYGYPYSSYYYNPYIGGWSSWNRSWRR